MSDSQYTPATWKPIIQQMIGEAAFKRINPAFALEWLTIESGGNPCAIGDANMVGPDGFPTEIGLGQLYNPDDFKREGITAAPFRAYCVVSTAAETRQLAAQYVTADAATRHAIAVKLQSRSRGLTPQEMDAQVRYTLLMPIAHDMAIADGYVATYGLHAWSVPDYWKLVKAPHAFLTLIPHGMPAVVAKLGRAPSSWNEFRTTLGMDDPAVRAKANAGQALTKAEREKWMWMRGLDACEACGNATAEAVA